MDIQRDKPRSRRAYVIGAAILVVVMLASVALTRLRTAVLTLDRGMLTFDTVTVGDMIRDVRAPGVLVPEHVRIIVATTGGRVEGLPVRAGEHVRKGTTIVQLSNADVDLAALQVQQQLTQAYAALAQLRSGQRQQRATEEGTIAQLRTQKLEADRAASVLDTLDRHRSAARNEVEAAHDRATELATRYQIELKRATDMHLADEEQVTLAQQQIDGLKQILTSQRNRVASMNVTAGEDGQLQSLGNPQLEYGQWVNSGIELARVVQPGRLKAVLHVPETVAKDVTTGLEAQIDTHDGIVQGRVTSIEPGARGGSVTVEVALDGPLPKGARADLNVDGVIVLERLRQVLHVGRPAYGSAEGELKVFRVVPNAGEAVRVDAKVGKSSVSQIHVRSGLAVHDSIIISDMTQMLTERRIRIQDKQ